MRYRKRPVVVEAIQFDGTNGDEVIEWAGGRTIHKGVGAYDGYAAEILRIDTKEGVMIAGPRDWIIRGIQGELYPCKPDIFAATYEAVDDIPPCSTGLHRYRRERRGDGEFVACELCGRAPERREVVS